MEKPRVSIFAGGDGTRWAENYPKELAKVDELPVLFRTLRMCYDKQLDPFVVTHKPEILDILSPYTKIVTERYDCLSEAVLWQPRSERTVNLLGDVYYSQTGFNKIFGQQDALVFANEVEIFAMRYSVNQMRRVEDALQASVTHFLRQGGRGKLWEAYRYYNGFSVSEHKLGGNLMLIEDETTDFDTVEEYHEFLEVHDGNLV